MADQLKSPQKILRAGQYQVESTKYIVHAPKVFRKTKEQEIDESSARIDELREEIRALEQELNVKLEKSETEAEDIIEKAETEAERLVKQAEKSAFDRVQSSLDEKEQVILEREHESKEIINKAQNEAMQKVQEAEVKSAEVIEEARQAGYVKGKEEGFEAAKEEVQHMVKRLHSVIEASIEERERIMVHSERQIINLVLTMVEKVVKKLTEEDHNVVINNIQEALKLVRGAMQVYIHVHPDDYNFTLSFKEQLIAMIEGNPKVKFLENPSIGRGGVFIETDLGEIDATIATQLTDIQDQIRYYMPVKVTSDIKRPLNSRAERPETPVDAKSVESSQIIPELSKPAPQPKPDKITGRAYWDEKPQQTTPQMPPKTENKQPAPAANTPPPVLKKVEPEPKPEIKPEPVIETIPPVEDETDNSLEQSLLISDDPSIPVAEPVEDSSFSDDSNGIDMDYNTEPGEQPVPYDDIEVQEGPGILNMDDFDLDKE